MAMSAPTTGIQSGTSGGSTNPRSMPVTAALPSVTVTGTRRSFWMAASKIMQEAMHVSITSPA